MPTEVFVFAAGCISVLTLAGIVLNPTRQQLFWLSQFRKDWEGSPARNGEGARKGVLERLNRMDGELSYNGGGSMKDKVQALTESMGEMQEKVAGMEVRQDQIIGLLEVLVDRKG